MPFLGRAEKTPAGAIVATGFASANAARTASQPFVPSSVAAGTVTVPAALVAGAEARRGDVLRLLDSALASIALAVTALAVTALAVTVLRAAGSRPIVLHVPGLFGAVGVVPVALIRPALHAGTFASPARVAVQCLAGEWDKGGQQEQQDVAEDDPE